MMARAFLYLLALATLAIAFAYGREVDLASQLELLSSLQTASSIAFAIFGAWMAIVYPAALQDVGSDSKETRLDAIEKVKHLLIPLLLSSLILFSTIGLSFAGPLMREMDFLLPHREPLRGLHYLAMVALLMAQLVVIGVFFRPILSDYYGMLHAHQRRMEMDKQRSLRRTRD